MSESGTPAATSVLVADDHPLMRRGLVEALAEERDLRIVAEAGDGHTALEHIERVLPNVAVLDIDMPGLTGLDIARRIEENGLPVAVILLTLHTGSDLFFAALDLGARGYILKSSAISEVVDGVRRVALGGSFFSAGVRQMLSHRTLRLKAAATQDTRSASTPPSLTAIESEILRGVAAGLTSRELAGRLDLSPRTVENYRTSICSKLGLSGPNALLRYGLARLTKPT